MSKKVEVRLFGSSGQTTVAVSSPSGTGHIPIPPPNDNRHCRAVFACLSDLETHFETADITEADYLAMVRSEFSVPSLSELSESMWARLSATLNACRRDPTLFNRLVAKVKAHVAKETPLTDASTTVFAEPEEPTSTCFVIRRDRITGEEKVIFLGEISKDVRKRCQSHADETRCIVQLYHAGRTPETFYPALACSPV